MSYFNQYGQYNNYGGSRRNSNSFSEENSGANRKNNNRRYGNRRRGGGNAGGSREINIDTPLFKEPVVPPRKSPSAPRRRSPVQNQRYDSYQGQSRSSQSHFDMRDMPTFVEPEHSGPKWHWDNYAQNCKSWLGKHQLSYYKSRCMALEFENQMLFTQINSLIEENCVFAAHNGVQPSVRLPDIFGEETNMTHDRTTSSKKRPQEGKERKPSESSSDLECELPQVYLDFVETRIRHKINLKLEGREAAKKKKAEEGEKLKVKKEGPKQPVGFERQKDLEQLYGKDSAMIHKLETSMQLNFNRNCDTFKPENWPAVPINPNTFVK